MKVFGFFIIGHQKKYIKSLCYKRSVGISRNIADSFTMKYRNMKEKLNRNQFKEEVYLEK